MSPLRRSASHSAKAMPMPRSSSCLRRLGLAALLTLAAAAAGAGTTDGIAALGSVNGLALACGHTDLAASARARMIERAARTRENGETFESATSAAFLAQAGAACPPRAELAVRLELALLQLPAATPNATGNSTASTATPAANAGATSEVRNPRYLLQDVNGRAILDSDFHGRFQLISFGYTFCPDICPTTLSEMAQVLKLLGEQAGEVQPLFVSVDPERDTLTLLRSYTAFFDPRILGATATAPELLRRSVESFGVRYAKVAAADGNPLGYTVDHSTGMILLGPDGALLARFVHASPVAAIVERIRSELQARPAARPPKS